MNVPFVDLYSLSESERIQTIGHHATVQKKVVGFLVDDHEKAERYIKLLLTAFPDIQVLYNGAGLGGSILVKVGPKQ